MRLVLIHGRAQGEKDEAQLRREWTAALAQGYAAAGVAPPRDVEVCVPFYGRRLDELTAEASANVSRAIERSAAGAPPIDPFEAELILTFAAGQRISDADIAAEAGLAVTERGPENWAWVQAAARLISRGSAWFAETVLARFIADVNGYLRRDHLRQEINEIVRPPVDGEAAVVVAHSLGSIVAYTVLHELALDADVPLLVTVGSPLGIELVKRHIPRPLGVPKGVDAWLNAADERDPVALYSRLEGDVFPGDIENMNDVANPPDDPHGVEGYLRDPRLAHRIAAALGS